MLKKAKRWRRENYIIPDMFALLLTIVVVTNGVLANTSAAAPGKSAVKYAEVEILFGDELGIEYVRTLPIAPGSDLEVLDSPKRLRTQLPASQVKALVNQGADIAVQRKFVLVEGSGSEGSSLGEDATILSSCSGPNEYGEDGNNVPIPDDDQEPEWVWSDIYISGAP
ncbi:MAG: hypothetical protein ACYTBZ_25225, partial [Planctomycetota bacterium]